MSILTVPPTVDPLYYHLHAVFQFRRIAVPTLVISTYVGTILAVCAVHWASPKIAQLAKMSFSRRIQHTDLYKYSVKGSDVLVGILTLAGVNISVSKMFNLPFSRLSSLGITVVAIAIPVLLAYALNHVASRYSNHRSQFRNHNLEFSSVSRFNSTPERSPWGLENQPFSMFQHVRPLAVSQWQRPGGNWAAGDFE